MTIKNEIAQDNAKWFPYDDTVMSEKEAREYDRERDAKVEMRKLELLDDNDALDNIVIYSDDVLKAIRTMIRFSYNAQNIEATVEAKDLVKALRRAVEAQAQKDID